MVISMLYQRIEQVLQLQESMLPFKLVTLASPEN